MSAAHGSQRPARGPGWDSSADLQKDPALVPDPRSTPVPGKLRATIEEAMARYPDPRSAAIPALYAAQEVHGWCSPQALEQVACVMGSTPAYLASVATFYDMLATTPRGRHDVYVCTNISCSLLGADALFDAIRDAAAQDPEINVRSFECLGACDIAPMASVDGTYVGPLSLGDIPQLLDDVHAGRPVLAAKQLATRPVADARSGVRLLFDRIDEPGLNTLAVYERRGGYAALRQALAGEPQDVLNQLEASRLRGRGGAGFQMGKKVSFLPKGSMEKYLVCNADESEPGTF
ncbi:MAG: NAD(P)H-dependent oxidoreductase subunit E, partial [Actinomycetota bacterium]|nr:NAD(P)H-dependent oxidoreductase subunit E [Actinomycetota bacterium]